MSWRRSSEAELRQYLLGALDPAGQARIEQQYLGDHAQFERLRLIEDELTDAYVRDELPAADRLLFERQYLADPQGREKVEAARVLMQCFAELPDPAGTARRPADRAPSPFARAFGRWISAPRRMPAPVTAAAALVLIVGLAGSVIVLDGQLRTARAEAARREQELRARAAQERERLEQLTAALQQERASRLAAQQSLETMQPGSIGVIVLAPGLLRDAGPPPRLLKRPNTMWLALQLQLPDGGYDLYRVILRPVSGGEVWRQEVSPPLPADTARMLTVTIPAARVAPGDYLVALQARMRDGAFDDASSYFFQVTD